MAENVKEFAAEGVFSEEDIRLTTRLIKDWESLPGDVQGRNSKKLSDFKWEFSQRRKAPRVAKDSFWNEDEQDPDMITDEIGEDDFEEDDMMSMAHGKLEEHREYREYARITVWEMPLLAKLAKPFEPPKADEMLRFRYTTYMGESHPADKKVVVEFSPRDLKDLTEAQQQKLMKLAGPRYNPEKEIIKISCERFEHQAQNKRFLGDMVDKMIAAAKDPTDTFEDVPLDTRHVVNKKVRPRFPKEWRLTEERKAELQAIREAAYQLDKSRRASGALVDGMESIKSIPSMQKQEELVAVKGRTAAKPTRQLR
ncbi:hypothetical protein OQA88_9755 [Cercophora sp. LCS_1]